MVYVRRTRERESASAGEKERGDDFAQRERKGEQKPGPGEGRDRSSTNNEREISSTCPGIKIGGGEGSPLLGRGREKRGSEEPCTSQQYQLRAGEGKTIAIQRRRWYPSRPEKEV